MSVSCCNLGESDTHAGVAKTSFRVCIQAGASRKDSCSILVLGYESESRKKDARTDLIVIVWHSSQEEIIPSPRRCVVLKVEAGKTKAGACASFFGFRYVIGKLEKQWKKDKLLSFGYVRYLPFSNFLLVAIFILLVSCYLTRPM